MSPTPAVLLHPHRARLGESPYWDEAAARIGWVDILAGQVLTTDLDGDSLAMLELDSEVGCVALRENGGLVAALRDGFVLLDADGGVEHRLEVDPDPSRRFNDGACTPAGTLLAGTMADDLTPDAGTIWSFDGHEAHPVLDGCTISNGMAWSADGRTLYYIDSAWGSIDAFDYEPSPDRLTSRRTVVTIPEEHGVPDGMVIDRDGCLWVALYGGAQVLRYDPEGQLLARVTVPAPNTTSLAFVGPELDRLAITTASQGLDEPVRESWPASGALFLAAVDVTGVPAHAFAG